MIDLKHYPQELQILMQTDGTVTELIKLFSKEDICVIKVSEKMIKDEETSVLNRHIYLQGKNSKINWLYAESKIYLDQLSKEFVTDLLEKNIPIGSLWIKYKMETFKQMIEQNVEISMSKNQSGFQHGSNLLNRKYRVYHKYKLIMEILEKFPVHRYENLK